MKINKIIGVLLYVLSIVSFLSFLGNLHNISEWSAKDRLANSQDFVSLKINNAIILVLSILFGVCGFYQMKKSQSYQHSTFARAKSVVRNVSARFLQLMHKP